MELARNLAVLGVLIVAVIYALWSVLCDAVMDPRRLASPIPPTPPVQAMDGERCPTTFAGT